MTSTMASDPEIPALAGARMIAADDTFRGAPLLRREFETESGHGAVTGATLAVTAYGLVEAWLNGRRVSGDLLTPGWSSYPWRLRYASYDVTGLIDHTNALGLALGKGWFGGRLGWDGGGSYYGDELGGLARLEVTFEDGFTQTIVTDGSWSSGPSAVLANDLYDGQTIDARLREDAWALPGYQGDGWIGVHPLEVDRTTLVPYLGPPVRRWAALPVSEIATSPSGRTIVDFGQNLVGWVRVRVQGPAGAEVVIRHAEVLEHGELAVRPLRSAKATDRYVLSGGVDVFEPTFTFHGFRYAEIEGWPGELRPEDLTAVAIGSELERIGELRTSDPLLDRLHENVVWSMRGNFLDVPTDCPQRDERLGWTGDIAVFAPTAAYLYDVKDLLGDWLLDLAAEQRQHDGVVAYVVPDILSMIGVPDEIGPFGATAIWGDSSVWVPWALYEAYGDEDILRRQFDSMTAHVRVVRERLSSRGVWEGDFQFGDWLDPDAPPDLPAGAKADPGVVATACAYRSAALVAEAATVLGRPDEAEEFRALAARLRAAFNDAYVADGVVLSDCATVYALAIVFGLLDPADEAAAGDRLAALTAAADHRITTGFAGTPFIADALTRTGYVDSAYRLLLQRENPSWLYPVTMGATTIWERWDSMLPDGTVNPGEMTSFNHYALGAIADWMHRTIGGIAPLAPGYSSVLIAPVPGGGLTAAEASLRTPHGRVSVRWAIDGDELLLEGSLPPEVDGVLRLPGAAEVSLTGGPFRATIRLTEQARGESAGA
jgi:alpha-L-rhamnosidase